MKLFTMTYVHNLKRSYLVSFTVLDFETNIKRVYNFGFKMTLSK